MTQVILWNTYIPDDRVASGMRSIGPYRLAQWLRHNGYTVRVLEYCGLMSTSDLVNITEQFITSDTVCIGASSTFWYEWKKNVINHNGDKKDFQAVPINYLEPDWVIRARSILQSRYPKLEWILGGAGVTSWTAEKQEYFQWQKFYGLSEDSLLKWLDEKTHKKYFAPIRKNFDICSAEHVFTPDDHIESYEVLPLEIARGCQFRCKFCRYPLLGKTKGTYIRSSELIKQELLYNYNNYGTTRYFIIDDTVNETEEKISDLATIAQSLPFELEWVGFNRLDLIGTRPHTISTLRDSGLRSPFFGIETFDPESSKIIGKGWNGKHAKEWLLKLNSIWGNEVNFFLGFIVGIGNESEDSVWESQEWCEKNIRGQWAFQPLSISQSLVSNESVSPSIFDLEYQKYGYSFPDKDKKWYWENSTWNWLRALDTARRVNNLQTRGYHYNSFGFLANAASSGYSFDYLMNTKILEVDWDEVAEKFTNRIDHYIKAIQQTHVVN